MCPCERLRVCVYVGEDVLSMYIYIYSQKHFSSRRCREACCLPPLHARLYILMYTHIPTCMILRMISKVT